VGTSPHRHQVKVVRAVGRLGIEVDRSGVLKLVQVRSNVHVYIGDLCLAYDRTTFTDALSAKERMHRLDGLLATLDLHIFRSSPAVVWWSGQDIASMRRSIRTHGAG
jgi:hypothetical protein